jgi:aminoglycoside phosphotransferase family enzyme/predicted kinase
MGQNLRAVLPDSLRGLLAPQAYPHPVAAVDLIETHISWVLLAGEFAYKIKRPVHYPFIDLRAPERRRHLCEEELRLNRRFAPQIYLDVCRVTGDGIAARIATDGVGGTVLEYAVRMRRFEAANELDQLLQRGEVEPGELESFGGQLAALHATLPAAAPQSPWGRPRELRALMIRNLLECASASEVFGAAGPVLALRGALERTLSSRAESMAARRAGGRVRECHGDLHARNIVRLGERLVAFDCLEYEPAFRWIDVADEIAFLASDLTARERPLHARAFLGGYLAQSGDYSACRVLRLYQAHRALVRATVAALEAATAGDARRQSLRREHDRLTAHAARSLAPGTPMLLVMCGLSGSGKTWLARRLAERLEAVQVRSDVERKRRAGLEPLARTRSAVAAGLYSAGMSAAVYGDLARAAEHILAGGCSVIVDAAFLRREQRRRFADLAARLGVPGRLVYCEAPVATLRARIEARERAGRDASEAAGAVLDWQLTHFERLLPEEPLEAIRVETARPQALETALRRFSSAGCDAPDPARAR